MSEYIEVHLEKQSNGYYRIRYFLDGKDFRKSLRTCDKKIALERKLEWSRKINFSFMFPKAPKNVYFKTVIDEYVSEIVPLRKLSHRRTLNNRLAYIRRVFGERFVSEIDSGDVLNFLNNLSKYTGYESYKSLTLKHWRDHFSILFNFAIAKEYLIKNPMNNVPRIKVNRTDERIKHLNLGEIRRLIENNPETVHIWKTFLYTGIKLGELFGLKWNDIDWSERKIHIRRSRTESTKGYQSRVVGLNVELSKILKEWKMKSPKSDYVFPNRYGFMRVSDLRTPFKTALKNANLEGVSIHNLRHTAAKLMELGGASPFEIQKVLGHSSIKTTLLYLQHSEIDLLAVANKIKI